MKNMFNNCKKLTSLDLSNFDLSEVYNTDHMFSGCSSLEYLKLSPKFQSSDLGFMSYMFYGCRSLKSLDLSFFDTSNILFMDHAFEGCESLTSLDFSNSKTSRARNMKNMFANCTSLTSLNLQYWYTTHIERNLEGVLSICKNLTLSIHKDQCKNLPIPDYLKVNGL